MFKHFRFLTHCPIHETILVFGAGYVSYIVSELLEFSGIITLLSSGITMAHYTWYNLSPQSKNTTSLTIEALGFAAEAFVFVYLGLTCFSYNDFEWSYEFFMVEFLVVMIGRYFGTVCLLYAFSFVFRLKRELSYNEAFYLYVAGMIRGAIAFGLVLRMDNSLPNREVIITTSLCLVIVTTVLFGSSMPIMTKYLLTPDDHHIKHALKEEKDIDALNDLHKVDSIASFYENFKHPNEESSDSEETIGGHTHGGLTGFYKMIDDQFFRPFLIYKCTFEAHDKDYLNYLKMKKEISSKMDGDDDDFQKHY